MNEPENEIQISEPIKDTMLIWHTELEALAAGEVCVTIKGSPKIGRAIVNNEHKLLALVPIMTNRASKKQFQSKFSPHYQNSKSFKQTWETNYNNGHGVIEFQYFFRVGIEKSFQVPNESQFLKDLRSFLLKHTVYSESNLKNYFEQGGRKIQIIVGRIYKLDEKYDLTWEVKKTAMSNIFVQPTSFEGIPPVGELSVKLVNLSEKIQFNQILQEFDSLMSSVTSASEQLPSAPTPSEPIPISPPQPQTPEPTPSPAINVDNLTEKVVEYLKSKDFILSDRLKSTIKRIAMFLIDEAQCIILTGRPGTGKSTIAEAFAIAAQDFGYIDDYRMITATSNWSAYETIGGYTLNEEQKLEFNPGLITEALKENQWVILDEMNRADIDKAFGAFFSILAGQSVMLHERDDQGNRIVVEGFDRSDPENTFRIIGTMNTADKASLFQLSYAFRRRFITERIDFDKTDIENLMQEVVGRLALSQNEKNIIEKIVHLWFPEEFPELPLGPALLVDFISTLKKLKDLNSNEHNTAYSHIEESFRIHLFDNLEVITDDEADKIKQIFGAFQDNFSAEFKFELNRLLDTSL